MEREGTSADRGVFLDTRHDIVMAAFFIAYRHLGVLPALRKKGPGPTQVMSLLVESFEGDSADTELSHCLEEPPF